MADAAPSTPAKMTIQEFLDWNAEGDARYELVNGKVRMMPASKAMHRAILAGLARHVENQVQLPCRFELEAAIAASASSTLWQADLAVVCGPMTGTVEKPSLLVELLSPSTRVTDLAHKLPDYKEIAGLKEIWLIDSTRRWVQVWHHTGETREGLDVIAKSTPDSEVCGGGIEMDAIYKGAALWREISFRQRPWSSRRRHNRLSRRCRWLFPSTGTRRRPRPPRARRSA